MCSDMEAWEELDIKLHLFVRDHSPDEVCNMIEEVVYLARQKNLKVDSADVHELLYLANQKLSIDELLEMHEQEQDIEEFESLDLVQSEYRM
ncbi:hypothetical protein TNCV_702581 [Trichonephila clavipes]|nr:hypothetical protein TNCV_702581 [Trichonephila clavipes]